MTTVALNQLLSVDTERGLLNRSISTIGGQPLTYNLLNTLVGLGGPISPTGPSKPPSRPRPHPRSPTPPRAEPIAGWSTFTACD